MFALLHWLQYNPLTTTINETGWMYAAAEITHYFSLFILVGTIVLIDLRLLGVAARSQGTVQLAEQLSTWTWIALVLAILSGAVMFSTNATAFFPDTVFRVKMLVISIALIFTVVVHRGIYKQDGSLQISTGLKLAALGSLVFWIGAILAGVEIAAISGLG